MKRIIVLFSVLCASLTIEAQTVSQSDAQDRAQTFINNQFSARVKHIDGNVTRQPEFLSLVKTGLTPEKKVPAYYLFAGNGGSGFVIVAGDERASHRILGYSATDHIDGNNLPENMQSWLDCYAEEMECLSDLTSTGVNGTGEVDPVGNVIVAPLIATQWNQDDPYNSKCPKRDGERTLVGCVAVAIGQIMNYHQWPKQGTGQMEYEWSSSWIEKDFSQSTYDYSNLDISQFLYDVAVGCQTDFYISSSSSTDLQAGKALINYFGYDKGMQWHRRSQTVIAYSASQGWTDYLPGWSDDEWETMIKDELDAGRPVYYSGSTSSKGAGHAFICDGYDDAGYFHFNWGWGGYCDGWFVTTALNPEYASTSYHTGESIITGIQPDQGHEQWLGTYGNNVYAWGFCDSLYVMYCMESETTHDKFYGTPKKIEMGKYGTARFDGVPEDFPQKTDIPDGTYRMYLVYQIPGTETCRPVEYGYGTDRDEPVESFQWVDIAGGEWVKSSSRTFTTQEGDYKNTFFILNDNDISLTNYDYPDETNPIVFPLKASYRGQEYTLKEVNTGTRLNRPAVFPETVTKVSIGYYSTTPITLPSSLRTLAFDYYEPTELTLPASLENFENISSSNLVSITFPANVSNLSGHFWCKGIKSIIFEPGSKVKSISSYYFSDLTRLKTLTLPDGIEEIGDYAFTGCGSLTKIDLPLSLANGHSGARSVRGVTSSSSSVAIGENAFCCQNLDTVVVHWVTPPMMDANVFQGLDLSDVVLQVPEEAVESYKSTDTWKDFGQVEGVHDTTDIEDTPVQGASQDENGALYDLQGRRVILPHHGIYIRNGKKIVN